MTQRTFAAKSTAFFSLGVNLWYQLRVYALYQMIIGNQHLQINGNIKTNLFWSTRDIM